MSQPTFRIKQLSDIAGLYHDQSPQPSLRAMRDISGWGWTLASSSNPSLNKKAPSCWQALLELILFSTSEPLRSYCKTLCKTLHEAGGTNKGSVKGQRAASARADAMNSLAVRQAQELEKAFSMSSSINMMWSSRHSSPFK